MAIISMLPLLKAFALVAAEICSATMVNLSFLVATMSAMFLKTKNVYALLVRLQRKPTPEDTLLKE